MIFLFKLEEVKEALAKIGIQGMTITEVSDFGGQKATRECIAGLSTRSNWRPKSKLRW